MEDHQIKTTVYTGILVLRVTQCNVSEVVWARSLRWLLGQGPWCSCFPSPYITLVVVFHPLPSAIPLADLIPSSRISVLCGHYAGLGANRKVNNTTTFIIKSRNASSSPTPSFLYLCWFLLQMSSSSGQLSCLPAEALSNLRKTSSAKPSLANTSLSRAFIYIQGPCLDICNLNHIWIYVAMEMFWICFMPGFLTWKSL